MFYVLRSSHQRCSTKKVFLKFLQNSLENTCIGVPTLIKFKLASKKVCPQPLPLPPVFGFSLEYPWAVPAKNKQGYCGYTVLKTSWNCSFFYFTPGNSKQN